jgi:hypothetical protein
MIALLSALFLFADPFWVSKPPAEWTDVQLQSLMADSPWAQIAEGPEGSTSAPGVQVFLATAGPIQAAEKERDRRIEARRRPGTPIPENTEYRLWMEDNRTTQIVLAVRIQNNKGFLDESEVRKMEQQTTLRAGKKKIKLSGSFPPSVNDPYLRLAFARQVELSDKAVIFELYLPGVPSPYRNVEFKLKDLVLNGKLEL